MQTFALSHTGLAREKNEDRYLIREMPGGAVLLAVADGMGGEAAGHYAAEIMMDTLAAYLLKDIQDEQDLLSLVKKADRTIAHKADKNPALDGMGSTVTCALLRGGVFYWAHVGDSRLFVLSGQKLLQVTTDQNMAQFLLEEGEITSAEARLHPSQNQLDQCVGCGTCLPEAGRMQIDTESLLILTTDGLHGRVAPEATASILNSPKDIKAKAKALIRAALKAGGKDDMTIVIAES